MAATIHAIGGGSVFINGQQVHIDTSQPFSIVGSKIIVAGVEHDISEYAIKGEDGSRPIINITFTECTITRLDVARCDTIDAKSSFIDTLTTTSGDVSATTIGGNVRTSSGKVIEHDQGG